MVAAALLGVGVSRAPQAKAANLYWDSDVTSGNNNISTGAGLGGAGTWDTTASEWFNGTSNQSWSNSALDVAYFNGTAGTVTLGEAITVGGLNFGTSGYTLTGNTLTLAGSIPPSVAVNGIGARATISSQVTGAARLTKTGNGVLALSGNSNSYSGGILVNQGTLVVSSLAQLGSGSLISVNGANQINNTGGQFVLQGGFTGLALDRYLSLSGRGFNYANSTGAAPAVLAARRVPTGSRYSRRRCLGLDRGRTEGLSRAGQQPGCLHG